MKYLGPDSDHAESVAATDEDASPRRPWQLYDVSRDPSEVQDVATEYREITQRLAEKFEKWQAEMIPMIPRADPSKPQKKKP